MLPDNFGWVAGKAALPVPAVCCQPLLARGMQLNVCLGMQHSLIFRICGCCAAAEHASAQVNVKFVWLDCVAHANDLSLVHIYMCRSTKIS